MKHLSRLTSDPTLGGMTTIEDTITLTVTNPNFKDEGDISWSSTCAGVTTGEADSFGYFSAFGVQVVATSQADKPRSVSFDVSVIGGLFTHLPSCSWIQNTGSFTVLKPAGTPPPQLDIDPAENLDELFVKPSDGTELGLSLQWTLDFEEVEMKAP